MIYVVLTGFTSGLGKALYEKILLLKQSDIRLICIGRNISRVMPVKDVIYFEMDLAQVQQWGNVIDSISSDAKRVLYISNASLIEPIHKVGKLEREGLLSNINVNYVNPVVLVNLLVEMSFKRKLDVDIFNITTGAATRPISGWASYCSSKSAFLMFLKVLNEDHLEHINVENHDPGVLDTDMQAKIRSKTKEQMGGVSLFVDFHNNSKLIKCDDAANVILKKTGLK